MHLHRKGMKNEAIANALSESISAQGHMVDVFDMSLEAGKIVSFYDYLIIGTETLTFLVGKYPKPFLVS